jgi:transposase
MHLRKAYNKKTKRTYLSIVHGFRDKNGKSKSKVIKSLGYLDALEKEFSNPISHFTALAKSMEIERKVSKTETITLDMDEQLEHGAIMRKNYGSIVFSKVYHELELDRFLNNARRHEKFSFNTEAMMRLLVYSRLLWPGSKRGAFQNKEQFFDKFDFTLDDIYDGLTHFDKISDALQQHLHEKVVEQYKRKTDLIYYDVTNYYFETEKQDDLRRNGYSKEKRKKPIVQMGLMMDKEGLPIAYKTFPGNTHDSQTLMPVLTEIKKKYKTKRIITVADKGLNSGDNIAFSTALGDGYIFSKSVRGASEDFKSWVLDESGYQDLTGNYKLKSKIVPDAEVYVTIAQDGKNRKKKKIKLEQKWIVFYSDKYAQRAKKKRDEVVAKAQSMIKNPAKYKGILDYGAAGYIKNLKVDKETGEVLSPIDIMFIDEERIKEEAKLDGYYALITSELDTTDMDIVNAYKALWRIEESFKITKSILGSRPMFVRTEEHINGHFLTCFVSLLIARIIEKRLGGKYTTKTITETLQRVACSNITQNIWLFDYIDEVTDDMNEAFGTNFGRKQMTLKEIKNNFSTSKK